MRVRIRSATAVAAVTMTIACSVALIPVLNFASCYLYAPGGACLVSERSRLLCSLLKAGDARLLVAYARRLRRYLSGRPPLAEFLDPRDVLVPVPGSEAVKLGSAPVANLLAEAFVREGLARARWDCLRRVRAVRRSTTAAPGERPTAQQHYDTLFVEFTEPPRLDECARLTLVDDVVTRGRTLLAAATRLHEAYPRRSIQAFALVRTLGFVPRIERLFDPCIGEICWRRGDARRNP